MNRKKLLRRTSHSRPAPLNGCTNFYQTRKQVSTTNKTAYHDRCDLSLKLFDGFYINSPTFGRSQFSSNLSVIKVSHKQEWPEKRIYCFCLNVHRSQCSSRKDQTMPCSRFRDLFLRHGIWESVESEFKIIIITYVN